MYKNKWEGEGKKMGQKYKNQKQHFEKLSKARIYIYTCAYKVCQNKWLGEGKKIGQECQNLGQL